MTPRVGLGYRALIIDNETPAYRLSQFLLRPDIHNRIIQQCSTSETLLDAYTLAENHELIYIDPFCFGLGESVRFIYELTSRSTPKAITLYRSERTWQSRQQDLESLSIPPERLRGMLFLDKDLLPDAIFSQLVKANITNMASEYQSTAQRLGINPETLGSRSGVFFAPMPDYGGGYQNMNMPPNNYPNYGLNPNQMNEIIQNVIASINRQQTLTPSHLLPPGPSAEMIQLQQTVGQLQTASATNTTNVGKVQEQVGKIQDQATKLEGQFTTLQEQLQNVNLVYRDSQRSGSQLEQRINNLEGRLVQTDNTVTALKRQQRTLFYTLVASVSTLTVVLIVVLVMLILKH